MATISVNIEDNLKSKAEEVFEDIGMSLKTAVTMFLKAAVRQKGIPSEATIDPFYSESNLRVLMKSIQHAEEGKLTTHELIEDE